MKKNIEETLKNVGVSSSLLSYYKSGKRYPSTATLKKLYIASGGKITPNDMYPLDEWREELKNGD